MPLPFVKVDQVDGALALLPAETDQICCVVGFASLAPANTLLAFRSQTKLRAIAGYGPGVEGCADQIAQNGVGYLCAPTSDVAGANGTVSQVGTSPTIGIIGTPNDDYRVRCLITKTGLRGVAQCQISIDGGNTYAAPVATAATIPLANTGLTLTFDPGGGGSFTAGPVTPSGHTQTISAVAPFGTTPPTITLTGILLSSVDVHIECTDIAGGAGRGSWLGRYSLDGGSTWTGFTSAATVVLGASGLTANIGTGNAAVDNVWRATTTTAAPPVITLTGTPGAAYGIRIECTTAGALGAGVIRWSSDGGSTWTTGVTTGATVALGATGLTANIAAGVMLTDNTWSATTSAVPSVPYTAGDTASVDCQAPYFSPMNFAAAGAAILADPAKREFGTMLVAGKAHGTTDGDKCASWVSMLTAAGTFRANADTAFGRYFRIVVEAPDAAATAIETAIAAFVDSGPLGCAATMDVQSPLSQLVHKRPGGGIYCARIGSITPQKHPGEVRQGKGGGGPLPSRVRAIYFGEDDIAALDAARLITVRTIVGQTGYFFSNGPTLDAVGADFSEHQFCRVADLASKITRDALIQWLNSDLAIKKDGSGRLTDVQADVIDADITSKLRKALVDTAYVVDAAGKVDRTIDVLRTSSLEGDTGVLRKGYAKFITWRVGFTATGA